MHFTMPSYRRWSPPARRAVESSTKTISLVVLCLAPNCSFHRHTLGTRIASDYGAGNGFPDVDPTA